MTTEQDPIRHLLEAVQLMEYRRAGIPPPSHNESDITEWIEAIGARRSLFETGADNMQVGARLAETYRNAYAAFPPQSRYEVVHYYMHLVVIAGHVIRDIEERYGSAMGCDALIFGTIPSIYPNATISKPNNDPRTLILFNLCLFPLAYELSRFMTIYGEFVETTSGDIGLTLTDDVLDASIAKDGTIAHELMDLFDAILFGTLQNLKMEIDPPPMPRGRMYQFILSGILTFMVSHEFSHLVAGHLGEPSEERKELAKRLAPGAEAIYISGLQELEADKIALQLSASVHATLAEIGGITDMGRRETGAVITSFMGADLALGIFQHLEICALRHQRLSPDTQIHSDTHPPLSLRRERLLDVAVRLYPHLESHLATSSQTTQSVLAYLTAMYLERISRPAFRELPLNQLWRDALAGAEQPHGAASLGGRLGSGTWLRLLKTVRRLLRWFRWL